MGEIDLPQIADTDIQANKQNTVDREQSEQTQCVGIVDQQWNTGEKNKRNQFRTIDEQYSFQVTLSLYWSCQIPRWVSRPVPK